MSNTERFNDVGECNFNNPEKAQYFINLININEKN